MRRIFFLLILSYMLYACMEKNNLKTDVLSIPIEECISEGMKKEDVFINKLNTVCIPLELTDSSILGDCYIVEDFNDKIIICDYQNVYAFHNVNGSFFSRVSHKGEGPEDYVGISDVSISSEDGSILILDNMGKKLNFYSINDGKFINSISNDTVVSIQQLKDNRWLAYNSPLHSAKYDICIYDKQWKLLRGICKRKGTAEHKGIISINDFLSSNGEAYSYTNDTIYHISETGDITSFLYIAKGGLSIPDEIASDITQKSKRDSYIWGEQICFSNKYCFLRYYYNRKIYFDIWNIHSKELCYRNIVQKPSDKMGLPIKVGNETYFTWPKYVNNNTFYCITYSENEDKIEDNPIVLKFKILS